MLRNECSIELFDPISITTQVGDGLGQAGLAQNLQNYWFTTAVDGWRSRDSAFRGLNVSARLVIVKSNN
jgi:hypothetical protein